MKKVLFIITKSNWGGAQRYVYDLATSLDPAAFEPVVALGGNGILLEMLSHAGIRTIPLRALSNTTNLRANWAAFRELRQIIATESPDVVHLNSSVAGFVGALAARSRLVPRIIFTAHGWAFNEDRGYKQKIIFKTLHWLTVLLSHHTIAVSRAIVRQMQWPLARRRMVWLPLGRTIGVMFPRAEAREKIVDFFPRLAPFAHDPWVFCIAELHPIKRHRLLIESWHQVRKSHSTARLICIGDGELRTELETVVRAEGLSEHVFFTGALHEAARYYHAADGAVLASASESYGYAIHEAGLADVPVVASAVGGLTDIITHEVTGLMVPPDDAELLCNALVTILKNDESTTERAARLRDKLKNQTVVQMCSETLKLYR